MVTPELFHANRGLLHSAQMLIVEGPLQKQEGVIHVLGRSFTELKLDGPVPKSHDFHAVAEPRIELRWLCEYKAREYGQNWPLIAIGDRCRILGSRIIRRHKKTTG